MQNIFSELKQFDSTQLKDVETQVKEYKPHVSIQQITDKEKPANIEQYDGEQYDVSSERNVPAISNIIEIAEEVLSPMEEFLISLGMEGDPGEYAQLLEESGFHTSDDLLVAEPSLEELEKIGVYLPGDRKKIFFWYHPEAAEAQPASDELANLLLAANLDPEMEEIMRLKSELETLHHLK